MSPVNASRSMPTRTAVVALIVVAAVLVGVFFARRPPRYDILDSRFGPSAWQPTKLLEVLSWPYHDNNQNPFDLGHPEFFDFQHQALLRLIDIQQEHFGHSAAPRNQDGTYIDHSFAHVIERTDSHIVVIGTATFKPCHYDNSSVHGPDPYWQMERLTFAHTGELLYRAAHKTE